MAAVVDGDRFRLVVLGDSTAFTDARGPQLPTEATLYPNVVGDALAEALGRPVRVQVLARAGTDVRDAYRTVTKDRHAMFEVLMGADAVIVGVGSIDHAPVGVPPSVEAVVPYLRPASVRRRARRLARAAYPVIARFVGARRTRTPRTEFARLFDATLLQVAALTQGAPGVVLGPTSHRSSYYGVGQPMHPDREALQAEIAARYGFPFVRSWELVEPFADEINPDGIHWPAPAHAAVARALIEPLLAQIRGERPSPPIPGF